MVNSKFTVAVHLLALMSVGRDSGCSSCVTSDAAAGSLNTNPVVARRILGSMRRAGLVSSQSGPAGGWHLLRAPDDITLRDVYDAVQDESLFSMHNRPPSNDCAVGRNIQRTLQTYFVEAEQAMQEKLSERTIADVVSDVVSRIREQATQNPMAVVDVARGGSSPLLASIAGLVHGENQ